MLGGIIGDLAASTWKKDKSIFYNQLIDSNTKFSRYGEIAHKTVQQIVNSTDFDYRRYLELYEPMPWEERTQFNLVVMATLAWSEDDADKAIRIFMKDYTNGNCEKEDYYASHVIIPLIISLRNGSTKDEAIQSLDDIHRNVFLGSGKGQLGSLGAISRAWDAFYRSFDFTSAIHSAVKSPVEPNLTALVTGLIAEAMYGSEMGMLKTKYSKNPYFYIELPQSAYIPNIKEYKERRRKFFPKNRALTNIERHVWKPTINPYGHITFDEDMYNKIRMALDTSWDNRYGIYLDDGWYYVYRSHYLLTRFKIVRIGSEYRIEDVQESDEKPVDSTHAMWDALYSIQRPPYKESPVPTIVPIFQYMSYYHGEHNNPFDGQKDPIKAKLWHGEKMFMGAIHTFEYWKKQAKSIKKKKNSPLNKVLKRFSVEQLAIRLYIETLYAKWCPYEKDFMWIYEN